MTDADDLATIGASLDTCIGDKAQECISGRWHIFAFCDLQGRPRSTLRVSLHNAEHKPGIAIKNSNQCLFVEEHADRNSLCRFSDEENAACAWFKEGVKSGSLKLQLRNIGETAESKQRSAQHNTTEMNCGFPLTSPDTPSLHQNAFDVWCSAPDSLMPKSTGVHVPRTVAFNRESALSTGSYSKLAPDMGTKGGKFMVPEAFRGFHVRDYHYATGQDRLLRAALADIFGAENLLPPEPYKMPQRLALALKPACGPEKSR